MGFLKVGQVGVLAAALAAPFVASGCHNSSSSVVSEQAAKRFSIDDAVRWYNNEQNHPPDFFTDENKKVNITDGNVSDEDLAKLKDYFSSLSNIDAFYPDSRESFRNIANDIGAHLRIKENLNELQILEGIRARNAELSAEIWKSHTVCDTYH